MKIHLLVTCLLASAFVTTVRSKPHGKHQDSSPHGKHPDSPKILEADPEQAGEGKVLPTSITFEADSLEQEDADVSYDDSEGLSKEGRALEEATEEEENAPILLSEEALADLLEESEEEEDPNEGPEEVVKEAEMGEESEEESDSSTESEIPADLDYAGDSNGMEPQEPTEEEVKPLPGADSELLPTGESQSSEEIPDSRDYESQEGEGAEETTGSMEEQEGEPVTEREGLEEMANASQEEGKTGEEGQGNDTQEAKDRVELGGGPNTEGAAAGGGEEEESSRNDSSTHPKGKASKQKKNRRAKKPSESRLREVEEGQGPLEKSPMEKEPDTVENTVQKSKKRKIGKWATLVGINPVQIRATEELYPFDRLSQDESVEEAPLNPCKNFRCKRGKTCQVNEENEPVCACEDPSSCTPSVTAFEHVCGTDNKTYDTSCELFATKCNLEGTKKGHRLHLDYTGSCKYIAPCLQEELLQFPLRMRDWLKNVLLQLYEHDTRIPGFLTSKQRARVQKIYENERRLHADDHPIEMLIRDFEKNYNMYIYPVHWQFAQMDQHPADRFLSHSELAPLRVPLVPMEHCTSLFFKECDADKDKQVSFREWGHCFGIKDEDMDLKLLF